MDAAAEREGLDVRPGDVELVGVVEALGVAVRRREVADHALAGLEVDAARNTALVGGAEGRFSTDGSRLAAWAIPTDEELLIARDTFRVVTGVEGRF